MTKENDLTDLFAKKSVESVNADLKSTGLHKSLGPVQLVLLGIGCILGAGVYVMPGIAAANYAGPAVILSFILAGIACGFIGLCYAELASVLPVSGASYTYAYVAMGEIFAWILGWVLMFEFSLAGAALAVGFSGYLVSLLADFNIHLPTIMTTPLIQSNYETGNTNLVLGNGVNVVAFLICMVVAAILARGISKSAAINTFLVAVKLGVLLAFVTVGIQHVDPENWTPFIPENEGGFHYGVPGIIRAASILFFAYLGFEAVATASAEAKNPSRDVPIGILGALFICTLLYIAVAMVMTGLVPYKSLNVPDPIAVAISSINQPVWIILIKAGALTGLGSVLLINTYAHSRVAFAMSSDGLLPKLFSRLNEKTKAPALGAFIFALVAGIAATLLPITLLADLFSLGTSLLFSVVALSVMFLRNSHPELHRPFKVPLGGIRVRGIWIGTVPVLALLASLAMSAPVFIDILTKLGEGEWLPATIVGVYLIGGVVIYLCYGRHNSKLRALNKISK